MVILLKAPSSSGQVGPQEIESDAVFKDRVPLPTSVKWLLSIQDEESFYTCVVVSHGRIGSLMAPHAKYGVIKEFADDFVPPTIETNIVDGHLELSVTNNEDHPIVCSATRTYLINA